MGKKIINLLEEKMITEKVMKKEALYVIATVGLYVRNNLALSELLEDKKELFIDRLSEVLGIITPYDIINIKLVSVTENVKNNRAEFNFELEHPCYITTRLWLRFDMDSMSIKASNERLLMDVEYKFIITTEISVLNTLYNKVVEWFKVTAMPLMSSLVRKEINLNKIFPKDVFTKSILLNKNGENLLETLEELEIKLLLVEFKNYALISDADKQYLEFTIAISPYSPYILKVSIDGNRPADIDIMDIVDMTSEPKFKGGI